MNADSSKKTRPAEFNLSPLGRGIVTEVLHEGKTFNLYRASLGNRDVVLKTPAPGLTGDDLYVKGVSHGSEMIVSTSQGLGSRFDPRKVATWMLLNEAQIINLTEGAWNHEVIAIGTWDGLSECWDVDFNDEPLDMRFLPALVLPYHDAAPFSRLPISLKRITFRAMLPSLWDALCRRRHGDLSESNLLINQTRDIFHIIDPGVCLSSDTHRFAGQTHVSIFTTTPVNYPIIPPYFGQPHEETGLVNFIRKFFLHTADSQSPAQLPLRPSACDLLAMGIIYYRILTGGELFLGQSILPEKPAWKNSYITPQFEDMRTFTHLIESLSGDYIEKKLDEASITAGERRLARSLLNLEVFDRGHLLELIPV